MDALQGTIFNLPPELYDSYLKLPKSAYKSAYQFGLVGHKRFCSMTRELEFHSNMSYMLHEIVDLVYSESNKAPPHSRRPLTELAAYLNSVGFQHENYTLTEFLDILNGSPEDKPPLYTLGHTSTDPTIVDFIQGLRLGGPSSEELCEVKSGLLKDVRSFVQLLRSGVPHGVMASLLSKKHYFQGLEQLFSIIANKRVFKLFGPFSWGSTKIPMQILCQLADLRHILVKLPNISNKRVAKAKLRLIIYFPEHAQFIYDAPDVIVALRELLLRKLTGWRRSIAKELNWESDLIKEAPLTRCRFDWTKNHHGGYKENLIFDSFIMALDVSLIRNPEDLPKYQEELRELFSFDVDFTSYWAIYSEAIIKGEFQGAIYSIVKDIYDLEWAVPDPLSEETNPDYESECVDKLMGDGLFKADYWIRSKYMEIMSGSPVSVSRFMLLKELDISTFVQNYEWHDKETRANAVRQIYELLANYCRPRGGYPKWLGSEAESAKAGYMFYQLWEHNTRHCNFAESLGIIATDLENDQTDYATRKFLLRILQDITRRHYPIGTASEMGFTVWSNSLKGQLFTMFSKLHEDKNDTSNCIIT